ncbi:MAG: hypothetical protein A3C85_03590 [Candidatus Doudnabacteria bacterium RIFCSPHIGHO2_02_FULL_48_21]|uniref:Cation-transporting P-type ATPase N-terminal domain-containing protein n=1 Tax=Candidatus Doudnabacteria bacterium RIFCSPLOWO2_02_FULL_48_13 TaxID=1817845 RepID=A0A1F5QC82_9BACT|nr:MAG: hypothetical protein A3K05_01990 [Candidatus Doudnabacteria bacterium RIFCSPHIGHO2_01_48_18]OGE77547.1 MAG: hypothetical protein A2668_03810 [Candidatus Doudnabacteria bacterium RIFCSPHIGHO2_01_FULL_48_180]OGE91242.1 MAG: hypothetical protein A3F44_02740 [Candidatus Doudnabacteria bacterium RIFCSPHIGHO2_12_FULL_47_25]OGE93692.1 MAG: hypothetical protein A3C85_03590 [Candidatus Doudnabacteria bacterium RIFCSPHIGHO2_02_FULL_48_21]OGE97338.1 MAG: hypothetical protein A3A83_03900 [Candidatu
MTDIKTNTETKPVWHALELPEVLKRFSVKPEVGLAVTEVEKRREKHGLNELPQGKQTTALEMFLRQFASPLVYILLVAAGLTWWIEEYSDMAVILVVVFVNAIIGLYQEYRANEIFEKLKAVVKVQALVIRGGKLAEIDSAELVPGDIVMLKGGNKVPADARLLEASNLEANEAILTGESKATNKTPGTAEPKSLVGDRKNMVFMGTVIERGEGKAVVVATGGETEIGQISALTQNTKDELSPLQQRMTRLGTFLTELFVVVSLAIFVVGIAEGQRLVDMAKTTIAVAVAAIPEGLPAAISIILAVSSQNILKRKGLVRKLVAAETLGSTSVISTDKTGTLTLGIMKVEEVVSDDPQSALSALALANEAVIEEKDGKFLVRGEGTDKAKLEKFLDGGGDFQKTLQEFPRVAILPFEESRKYIASFHKHGDSLKIFVSGAPETVIKRCTLDKGKQQEIAKKYENYANRGYRLIAVAQKTAPMLSKTNWSIEDMTALVHDLEYLGLAAIRDPIRTDVKQALKMTRDAGIRVLMVTGDHILTAKAIGLELGFGTGQSAVMNGEEMDKMSDAELSKRLANLEIIARVTPTHKMRIIDLWQKKGAVVAMTGDGVNDAPALKSADIGVAVGSGTDVSKEASDLVLLDDSFSTITASIQEGRTGFSNIRKATVAVMSNAFTEIILITSSLVLKTPFLPISAIQILWVNLAEDSLPVLAMAFEPSEKEVMQGKPTSPKEPILDKESKSIIFIVSLASDLILVGIFYYLYKFAGWNQTAIQSFVFVAAATPTLLNVFAFKSFKKPLFRINIFNNKFLIVSALIGFALMFVAIYVPFFNRLLKTEPLALWPALFAFVAFPVFKLILVELTKWWYHMRDTDQYAKT